MSVCRVCRFVGYQTHYTQRKGWVSILNENPLTILQRTTCKLRRPTNIVCMKFLTKPDGCLQLIFRRRNRNVRRLHSFFLFFLYISPKMNQQFIFHDLRKFCYRPFCLPERVLCLAKGLTNYG